MRTKAQVLEIVRRLEEAYPLAECTLDYKKDYELLFSVRLAAQCTDARVNEITPALFARFSTLQSFAEADVAEVEEYVRSCGFYRAKARDIVGAAQMILRDFGGRVPDNMDDLLKLPGVGRKTANLILGDVYHVPGSTVVDTHCIRISNRLGLVDDLKDPVKIEAEQVPAAGEKLRLLPPHRAARPRRLHRAQARLRRLHPALGVPICRAAGVIHNYTQSPTPTQIFLVAN